MGDSSIRKVKNTESVSSWKKLQEVPVGPHFKLETQVEHEHGNSIEVRSKGGTKTASE